MVSPNESETFLRMTKVDLIGLRVLGTKPINVQLNGYSHSYSAGSHPQTAPRRKYASGIYRDSRRA